MLLGQHRLELQPWAVVLFHNLTQPLRVQGAVVTVILDYLLSRTDVPEGDGPEVSVVL